MNNLSLLNITPSVRNIHGISRNGPQRIRTSFYLYSFFVDFLNFHKIFLHQVDFFLTSSLLTVLSFTDLFTPFVSFFMWSHDLRRYQIETTCSELKKNRAHQNLIKDLIKVVVWNGFSILGLNILKNTPVNVEMVLVTINLACEIICIHK